MVCVEEEISKGGNSAKFRVRAGPVSVVDLACFCYMSEKTSSCKKYCIILSQTSTKYQPLDPNTSMIHEY